MTVAVSLAARDLNLISMYYKERGRLSNQNCVYKVHRKTEPRPSVWVISASFFNTLYIYH